MVSTAQAKADKAKMDALKAYIEELLRARAIAMGGNGNGGTTAIGSVIAPTVIPADPYSIEGELYKLNLKNAQNSATTNIIINAGVIADQDELSLLIQRKIQSMNRNGYDLNVAGAINS